MVFSVRSIAKVYLIRSLLWAAFTIILALAAFVQLRNDAIVEAVNRSRDYTEKDIIYREWAARQGGVYVRTTKETPVNEYLLSITDKASIKCNGENWTLINPAYMTRAVYELEKTKGGGVIGRLVSERPVRLGNKADDWESNKLKSLNAKNVEAWEKDKNSLRYIRLLTVEKSCIECHPKSKVGESLGGISITTPIIWHNYYRYLGPIALLWLFGAIALYFYIKQNHLRDIERDLFNRELQQNQKLESIGSLASGIAHDMNNILAVILAVSSVIKQDKNSELITKAVLKGKDLANKLTNFARKSVSDKVPVELADVILQNIELLKMRMLSKVKLSVDIKSTSLILGNASDLSSVFMNLWINSIDAMPLGGKLTTSLYDEGEQVVCLVIDTGHGISKKILEKVTEPFFTTKPVGKGTGLGLSLAYAIVKAHGGTLKIDSEIDSEEGTRVTLKFPIYNGKLISKIDETIIIETTQSLKLLLIDDDELVKISATDMIRSFGHKVTAVDSGICGLRLLEAEEFDLIILDKNMPEMDGIETFKRIRKMFPNLPVILASGYLDEETTRDLYYDTHIYFLNKPYTHQELNYALNSISNTLR